MAYDVSIYARGVEDTLTTTNGITADQEDSDYPIENVQSRNINTLYKPGSTALCTIKIELAETIIPDVIVLPNTNAYDVFSANGICLTTTSNDDWGFTGTVEWWIPDTPGYLMPVAADQPHWVEPMTDTHSARKFWKFQFLGHTAVFQFATILLAEDRGLGASRTPLRPRDESYEWGINRFRSSGGHDSADEDWDERMSWTLNWAGLNATQKADLVEFWREIHGGRYPFLFRDYDDTKYWVQAIKAGKMRFREDRYLLWGSGVNIEEAK